MVYNAGGSDELIAETGSDPLTAAARRRQDQFRWINHTYTHPFLGCVQDSPSSRGAARRTRHRRNRSGRPRPSIDAQITRQHQRGPPPRASPSATDELVTGEHSGLKSCRSSRTTTRTSSRALDRATASSGSGMRHLPRARAARGRPALDRAAPPDEHLLQRGHRRRDGRRVQLDLHLGADGGSGICDDNPATTTCIAPLDPATGFTGHIVPERGPDRCSATS